MTRLRTALVLAMLTSCREDAFDRKSPIEPDRSDVAAPVPSSVPDGDLAMPDTAQIDELAAMVDAPPGPKSSAPAGSASIGPPKGAPGTTPTAKWIAEAKVVLTKNQWRFRACHSKALAVDPTSVGKLVVTVKINGEGEVMSSVAKSTTAPTALTGCIVRSFDSMRFPEPDGGIATIEVPIDLSLAK